MIRILLSATWLTPDIEIKNSSEVQVSIGEMTELWPSNDGRFWYGYTYNGVPGAEYHIIIDAGIAIEEAELRYFDFYLTEEYAPADIADAVRAELTTELARLDATISSRMATFSYTAPDNTGIAAIKTKTDQLTFTGANLHSVAKLVEDKTGYALTAWERTAIATAVETAILNEGDGQAILNAIVGAIGNSNIDQVALVAAIRADLERVGGKIDTRATASDVSIQLTSSPNASVPISIIV